MHSNLKLIVNNPHKQLEERQFFERDELKIIWSEKIVFLFLKFFPISIIK